MTTEHEGLAQDLKTAWHRFVDETVPLRPDLYAYCRRLTGSLWDAEDLVQDTLTRAFSRWGVTYPAITHPKAYLLRTATNVWIDSQRRSAPEARGPEGAVTDSNAATSSLEVRGAGCSIAFHRKSRRRSC